MEEELNEHDLEERLYAMLHHVDESEGNVTNPSDGLNIVETAPRSTVRRYWRTSEPSTPFQKTNTPKDSPFQKVNTPKEPITPINKQNTQNQTNTAKPKEEKRDSPENTVDLSIFQSPIPQNFKRTIEIIEEEETQVLLESSDEDEVIEVALPPKPTITIESSDEDELQVINPVSPNKNQVTVESKAPAGRDRDVSASPAPSAVSSVSDDFIRGDCIALNISSRHQDNPSFDFSLHGSDLLVQNTPSKKKRKKKNKDATTSTPIVVAPPANTTNNDGCFATPKSKAKNKKQKNKFTVTNNSPPNADVYDSDSNQSIDTNKNRNSYVVTEKSLPSTDVYESDSNMSECAKEPTVQSKINDVDSSDSNMSLHKETEEPSKTSKRKESIHIDDTLETISIVDLTDHDRLLAEDESDIQENIVMGNVSGFSEFEEEYGDENMSESNVSKFGSTKIPSILNEDLDFDNLKGKDKVCKRRRYSLSTLRAEMEKFYNESWGGENFNHREIQKNMSRDKSLWVIDPKDRMPSLAKRKITCNYCNRAGHRDDTCRLKPAVCYMCGSTGHYEPRCPRKICVNCGSPNQMYSSMCRNCSHWGNVACVECGQRGHPASHCPDLWRRYHNTIDNNTSLERSQPKKLHQLYCSGCSRRGHLLHTCRITIPFTALPVNSPYVYFYRPIYPPTPNDTPRKQSRSFTEDSISSASTPFRNERNKRQSKSPTAHETHVNKKRNLSACDETERRKSQERSNVHTPQRKSSTSKDEDPKKDASKSATVDPTKQQGAEKAPNFIPLCSANRDKKGNMIQDNEVSDTSDVVTSARIYITNDIIDKLKTDEGMSWLKETTEKHNVDVQPADVNSFLSIKGKLVDQEGFQTDLRDWAKPMTHNNDNVKPSNEGDTNLERKTEHCDWSVIPKNRNNLLRQLTKSLESLKEEIGDPSAIYKELMYFQNNHEKLLKQRVISPKQLNNSRGNVNQMLKKLNMVLLGQAGLADGSSHVSELYTFQEKLMNLRQKNIPTELRKEIGQHYVGIFTAIPRDDYMDLLRMYYMAKQTKPMTSLKKKKKKLKLKPKGNTMKVVNIPAPLLQNSINEKQGHGEKKGVTSNNNALMMQKLAFYHKRLLSTRPALGAHKKTRGELVRKLHSFIASMYHKENMSSKTLKKMRKAQEQAQTFLANV